MATKPLITAEQFGHLTLGETEDYELVEGELIPLSSGTPKHAEVRDLVITLIRYYLREHPIGRVLGEIDCQITSDTVRRPDVAIFLGPRAEFDRNRIPIPYAPDIAVEVLSPSESAIEVRRKVREYLRAGSREVWLLDDANGEVVVHTSAALQLVPAPERLQTPLLPGFSVAVADLFV